MGNEPGVIQLQMKNFLRALGKTWRSLLFLVPAFALAACVPAASPTVTSVARVIDGDTVVLSTGKHLRYIGIDTPEMNPLQPFAQEATDANRRLVEGKSVRLEKDLSETDRYDRLLRYVWVGNTMVNLELVRLGLAQAKSYPPDVRYQSLFEAAEVEAKLARRGMWAK
jgi:micrococcal nuclease